MAKNLFVAGLDYSVTDDQLQELFASVGTVVSAKVIMDRDTNRSKGFGFVEMSTDEEAAAAVSTLNETEFQGRSLAVREARPRGEQPNNRFSNNNRGNSGGGGGSRYGSNDRKGGGDNRYNKRDDRGGRDW